MASTGDGPSIRPIQKTASGSSLARSDHLHSMLSPPLLLLLLLSLPGLEREVEDREERKVFGFGDSKFHAMIMLNARSGFHSSVSDLLPIHFTG